MKGIPLVSKSFLVIISGILIGSGAVAQSKPNAELPFCPLTEGQDSCTRILACIGTDGDWFNGRAFGRGTGTLAGRLASGAICTGEWKNRNVFGFGQADVICDDGMGVRVIYTQQDGYTGTAIGRGLSNTGKLVKGWSGLHVLEYLSRETGLPDGVLLCGEVEIPIS